MGKNEILMTFGKYKFQSIEKVFNDKYYYNWIIKQNFFKVQYPKLYNALKNYEEKPKYIEQKKTPIRKDINFEQLPDDIKQLIFTKRYELMKLDKQEKINELLKTYPYVYKCSKCNKNEYYRCPICNYDPNTSTCGDCNVKEKKQKQLEYLKLKKSNQCKCGKYKKSGYMACYSCNYEKYPYRFPKGFSHLH